MILEGTDPSKCNAQARGVADRQDACGGGARTFIDRERRLEGDGSDGSGGTCDGGLRGAFRNIGNMTKSHAILHRAPPLLELCPV